MLCLTSFSVDQKKSLNKTSINPIKYLEKSNKIFFSGAPEAFCSKENHVDIKCKKTILWHKQNLCRVSYVSLNFNIEFYLWLKKLCIVTTDLSSTLGTSEGTRPVTNVTKSPMLDVAKVSLSPAPLVTVLKFF